VTREQRTHREIVEATAAAEAGMRTQTVPVNVFEDDWGRGDRCGAAAGGVRERRDDRAPQQHAAILVASSERRTARLSGARVGTTAATSANSIFPTVTAVRSKHPLGTVNLAIRVLRGEPAASLSVKPTVT